MTTGEQLKQMRTLMGLNQRELADAVKVHKTDISAFERDVRRIPVYSLHKLASFFNTPPEYIQIGGIKRIERLRPLLKHLSDDDKKRRRYDK